MGQGSNDSALAETLVKKVMQNSNTEEKAGGTKKERLVVDEVVISLLYEVVTWVDVFTCEFNFRRLVEEHLAITQGPVAKRAHENRSTSEEIKDPFVQFLIIMRWLSGVVCQGISFDNIQVKDTKASYGDENW